MPRIQGRHAARPAALPSDALLAAYRANGAFTDCYLARIDGHITHAEFVQAFYTTWLFKLERAVLAVLARAPSSDDDAQALALGQADAFAVWTVERRAADQLLMLERSGATRSWLMVAHPQGAVPQTLLYFGSALILRRDPRTGQGQMSRVARALLGLHALYSRALLNAARARLLALRAHRSPM
jgi:hypothetical protein